MLAEVTRHVARRPLPVATYRLQFHSGWTFRQATELVPWLAALGVSDVYASPILRARPGSAHGYDVIDHGTINPEIGTREELKELADALHRQGMGLILDVVPNHMSVASDENVWWLDVLENGPSSPYAGYFDIDWTPLKPDLTGKVLLPVLGDQFGRALEEGQLVVRFNDGAFQVRCHDRHFPLGPWSYPLILADRLDDLRSRLGEAHPDLLEYLSVLTAIGNLPPCTETDANRVAECRREKEIVKRRLRDLAARSPETAEFIAENVERINGRRGEPASFDRLDELLRMQAYRLAYWRVASDEINYRRFFDVNDLAAICVENPEVFEDTHRLVFELLEHGVIDGLRIDHPDGLYDPPGYLWKLQERRFLQKGREAWRAIAGADEAWPNLAARLRELWWNASRMPGAPLARPLYVVVEKILEGDESMPADWPVHGTVGYEFLDALSGLFVDPAGEQPLSNTYARFTGETLEFDELAYQCKRLIVRTSMSSELHVLAHRLDRLAEHNRWTRDFTLNSLMRALQELMACFGVYRTYVDSEQILERDRRFLDSALARARRRNPEMETSIFDFLRDLLLMRFRENADEAERRDQRTLVGKFQQLTGPIMAKAIEDTAFYRFNRLTSLNEVGGAPERFGSDVARFHEMNRLRLPAMSHGLSSSSTHDTKRGEDTRARIHVLSEVPRQWRTRAFRWARHNRRLKSDVDGEPAPSRNDEYLLYQTLVGVWPDEPPEGDDLAAFVERLQQYMLKVAREAKTRTSWISPNEPYERALQQFVAGLFDDNRRTFEAEFGAFAAIVADHGRWNSLSQLVLKLASPGVPDFFQGTELWTHSLVDPDNRRPVDFEKRRRLLDALGGASASFDPVDGEPVGVDSRTLRNLLDDRRDGRIKMYVTARGLWARRRSPELFTQGEYIPLEVRGRHAQCLAAFARRHDGRWALAAAPRLTVRLCGFGGSPPLGELWDDADIVLPPELSGEPLIDCFTGARHEGSESLSAREIFSEFPVSLMLSGPRRVK